MPYSETQWEDEEFFEDPWAGGFENSEDFLSSVWKPGDPSSFAGPRERHDYRNEMDRMVGDLRGGSLGDWATAHGTSGSGGGYEPAGLGWTKWGNYQPHSRVGLSSWGWNHGLGKDAFPILSGAIVAPTINIFTDKIEDEYDSDGRPMSGDGGNYRTRVEMRSGRQEVGLIMQEAANRGKAELERLMKGGMSVSEAGLLAERTARQSVRSQVQPFGRADFGERQSYPYALREAIKGSANIRFNGDYSLGPKALFQQLGSLGSGYFTKSTMPSVEMEHPERGAWQGYSLDSLYALGWLRTANGGFITGSNKPAKRRQLGVQKLAAPVGADHLMNTGRITGDKLLNTHAVFVSNYAYSEGSGAVDPTLVEGFRSYRPKTIERPMRAGKDWEVDFGPTSNYETVTRRGGFLGLQKTQWNIRKQQGIDWSSAGEDVFIGQQKIGGKMQDLEMLPGKDGVIQNLYGYRKTKSGYQALIETVHPFESGTAKLMHGGNKALLFQASSIISGMQQKVRSAIAAGVLPGDVQDPRMVLPMPKDWMQNYFTMFDQLPEETLRGMGISDKVIQSKNWQSSAPEVIDRMKAFADQRRFNFTQEYDVPVSRLGAFTNAGNARNIQRYMKGDVEFAKFEMEHTGYALPIAAGIRMEYPGKKPMHSAEELMQMGMGGFSGMAKKLMSRGNAASRIWGVAAAASKGVVPEGAISHDMLPWMSARLNLEGNLEDEGTSRKLIANLARELQDRGHGRSAIVGPDGVLLPSPADVMGKSVKGLNGQEQSTFVSSYIQALKLMGTGQDPTEALAGFAKNLQEFAAGHNVRREALGARLDRGAEGTFTSHMSIPDDVVIVGDSVLRKLGGINRRDPDAQSKMDAFVQQLEGGQSPFYVLGTRRPVSDMFNQLGVPMKVMTERMAQEMYGVPIENLGRSYAVSPTVAAVWRGDVDADRALLTSATDPGLLATPWQGRDPETGAPTSGTWYTSQFRTSREVRNAVNKRDYIMKNQLAALEMRAPDEYAKYISGLTPGRRAAFEKGDTLALSEALHGIDVDWNESKKWSDELVKNPQKNLPMGYSYYADASRKENKTVFSRQEMLAEFEKTAKSKMLMGRGYNRYLRGLTSLAQSPEELQGAVTLASGIYQKALDNQKMTKGELMMFNAMEAWGPGGAMYDKFIKEEGYVGGGAAWTGGAAGIGSVLADAIGDMDAPLSVRAMLFSRDPAIRDAVMTGNTQNIMRAIDGGKGEVRGAEEFLYDPARAGILPQLVFSMHFSKNSMAETIANERNQWKKAAYEAYAGQGKRIRSATRILSKNALPMSPYTEKDMKKNDVAMPGAIGDIRNMGGLNPLPDWQIAMARRMGMGEGFFAGPEAVNKLSRGIPSFANPALPGEEFPAYISKKEADVLEGLRQMPASKAQSFAAAVSRPARYTPKGGAPSFNTGPGGWDQFSDLDPEEQERIRRAPVFADEFKKVVEERQARKATVGQSDPGYDQGTVPPAAGGGGFSNAQKQAAADALRWAAEHRANRAKAQPTAGDDPARAFEDLDNQGWEYYNPESLGPNRRHPRRGEADIPEEDRPAFKAAMGAAFRGEDLPENPYIQIAQEQVERIKTHKEIDATYRPWLIPILQEMAPLGTQLEMNVRSSGRDYYSIRAKYTDMGLIGNARSLMEGMVREGLEGGYTPAVKQMMEQGYQHKGIGQGMIRSVRNLMDTNLDTANSKQAWRAWDDAQKIRGALGEDAPEALLNKMEKLDETINKLTEVEKKRVEQVQKEIEANPNYQQAQTAFQNAVAAQAAGGSAAIFSPDQSKMFAQLHGIRKLGGMATDDIDQAFEKSELAKGLAGLGGEGKKGGRFDGLKKLFVGSETPGEESPLMNLWTDMSLGFTAFRARMAWNLTTGAQKGWMQDFLGQESAGIGAAFGGGAVAGPSGAVSSYISQQAAMANTRARLGEGVAQVYGPISSVLSNVNAGPNLGAAATLLGTPIGAGAVAGMGSKMVLGAMGSSTALAGPIGMGVAMTAGGLLATSYMTGLGENWQRAPEDSFAQNLGMALRPYQIAAEQRGQPSWFGTIQGANNLIRLTSRNAASFGAPVAQQFVEEGRETLPGTLIGDATELRTWADNKYHNRVDVDKMLGVMGTLFQVTGTRGQDLYEGKSPDLESLLDLYADYMASGADPSQLINSQMQSARYGGAAAGPQMLQWMRSFASSVPGEQRQMYEDAYQSLSAIPTTLGRLTAPGEARGVVKLTEKYGSIERAATEVMGRTGVGWFTQTFGVQPGMDAARNIGQVTQLPLVEQQTVQAYGGTVASSGSRMGLSPQVNAAMSMRLANLSPDDVLRVSNLMVQAESVSLEAGKDGKGFQDMVFEALGAGMQGKSVADARFFMATGAGVAGIAPQAFVSSSQQAIDFEKKFRLAGGQDRIQLTTAAGILNSVYPEGYSPQQAANVAMALGSGRTIGQVTMQQRAMAGTAGVGVSMGLGYGSAGAQLIDSIMTQGVGPGQGMLGSKEVSAFSQALNANNFMYMNAQQMSGITSGLQQGFSSFYNNPNGLSLHQFNRLQEGLSGSTPWGYSSQLGFGPGSLTDRLGRQYGMYSGDPGSATWTASNGGQYAPLFDLQQSAGYASLGYASASNEAQSRQFARQQAQMRREWGSGPFQSMGTVQAAMFPTDGTEAMQPGGGMEIGGSQIGFAQQESAIRRQMWQESIAAQQQSIEFSRQSLEISRQELGIAKQELALSKEQYGVQREYKLGEQQAQRGMQLRQYEWAAEDYSIKVERTGITQQWQMEDLERSRRYATGRQRVEIERQIERTQVTQGWERDDTSRGRNRELEVQRYQDQRYEAAVAFEEKLNALQMRRFDLQDQRMALQEQRLALQEAQLAAQEARLNTNKKLQEDLNKLEDERFKAQYEQTQEQMVDDEKLEKLRKGVRDAEIAYQAASLANAATLNTAQEKFTKGLEGIDGPLDKLIEFLNAIRNWQKPPDSVVPPPPGPNGNTQPFGTEPEDKRGFTMNPTIGMASSAAPTIVNFVLDGEVIMTAVATPERLRPVVQEVNRRDSWR